MLRSITRYIQCVAIVVTVAVLLLGVLEWCGVPFLNLTACSIKRLVGPSGAAWTNRSELLKRAVCSLCR